jgi:hypothetical protein
MENGASTGEYRVVYCYSGCHFWYGIAVCVFLHALRLASCDAIRFVRDLLPFPITSKRDFILLKKMTPSMFAEGCDTPWAKKGGGANLGQIYVPTSTYITLWQPISN